MKPQSLEVIKQLAERNSLDSIKSAARGKELKVPQQLGVLMGLLYEKAIISFDTGLGKTVIAMALINMLVKPNEKALFIVKRTTLDEIYSKDKSMLSENLTCGFITNQQAVIRRMIERNIAETCNLLVISSDCISNEEVNNYLFSIRFKLKVVVVDEMHLFANLESVESRLMQYLVGKATYAYALTATPFQREIDQLINTAYMLNNDIFKGMKPRKVFNYCCTYTDGKISGYRNLDKLKKLIRPVLINVTRESLGINVKKNCTIHWIKPETDWLTVRGSEAISLIKGDVTKKPFYELVEILDGYVREGMKGLVYANLNNVKGPILEELRRLNFRVGIVDGSISIKSEREATKELFRDGEIDVLIINTPISFDLECDFVVFYELTLAYTQMKGRPVRSYKDKEIFIDFIIAESTYEEEYFYDHVYDVTRRLSEICSKDCSELVEALGGRKFERIL